MPRKPDTMSIPDATVTLLLLAEWNPPEGLTVTVSSSCHPDTPGGRVVNIVLSAVEDQFCVINVGRVPDSDAFDALTQAARLLLDAAWEQPACLSMSPAFDKDEAPGTVPAGLLTPGGPLNLRSIPHPLYETTRFGRDD